jgi:hypothetical protein
LRTEHRTGNPAATTQSAFRLQGGLRAGLGRVLAEDVLRAASERLRTRDPHAAEAREHRTVTARAHALGASMA